MMSRSDGSLVGSDSDYVVNVSELCTEGSCPNSSLFNI